MFHSQGKPAQAKGQDRLGGRSRIKVEEENIYLYLSEVRDCVNNDSGNKLVQANNSLSRVADCMCVKSRP